MRIGLQIVSFTWPGGPEATGGQLAEIARAADEAGFYSLWVMDHFFQIRGIGQVDEPMLEGYTTLGYLAGLTRQVKLGTLVTGVIYRHPGILAKTATTLDVLSGGRAYLGIGAAWFEREALGLGVPFPPLRDRFEQLEECLQIAHQMWRGEVGAFEGRHYRLAETLNSPPPVSRPHPPILIGGEGERKTLRLVARYGDACNFFAGEDYAAVLPRKLAVLKQHCEEAGRDYDSIEKTTLTVLRPGTGGLSAGPVIEKCRQLASLGFDHAIFNMPDIYRLDSLEVFSRQIIPAAAGF